MQISLKHSFKTKINLDCVKVCPLDKTIWAFSYYQQHPQFMGGIQVCQNLQSISSTIFNIGPIMHIEWLHQPINQKFYILAASRNDKVFVCSVDPVSLQISVDKQILLDQQIFCLYCHWTSTNDGLMGVVSSNQSKVYQLELSIDFSIKNKYVYNKHQYAVWACRLNNSGQKLVVGDQVNTLYLYDTHTSTLMEKNKKAHNEGICQIFFHSEYQFYSGSFDGSIVEIDVRNFNEILRKFNIGGTIWRIIPFEEILLICNSSEKVFQFFSFEEKVIWNSKQQHDSLAYAADHNGEVLITVSFYDQNVRIWRIDKII